MPRPDVQQTSLRLEKALYQELRQRAQDTGEAAERIIHRALWKELRQPTPNIAFHAGAFYNAVYDALKTFVSLAPDIGLTPPEFKRMESSALEAYRFLQALPLTCQAIIKEVKGDKAVIVWANESMERASHRDLDSMIGKTIDKLGVLTGTDGPKVLDDIRDAIKSRDATESLEVVQWPGRGAVALRVVRFMFTSPDAPNRRFLGDLSFDFAAMENEDTKEAPLRIVSQVPTFPRLPAGLFQAFLETASEARIGIAIKDAQRHCLWTNRVFAERAGFIKNPEDILGRTVDDNTNRPLSYQASITESDAQVVRSRLWMFRKHWLEGMKKPPLVSLRFPIYDQYKQVERIGVLNGHFNISMQRIEATSVKQSARKRR